MRLLQVSRVHVYLTFPFVLSWSLVEAMAIGCVIVASDTAPVREAITHGENGLLTPFLDPDALADKVTAVLAHPARFELLREAARVTALARFDKSLCLKRAMELLGLDGEAPPTAGAVNPLEAMDRSEERPPAKTSWRRGQSKLRRES